MKNKQCENCICMECTRQSQCEKSCKQCETITGRVSYCKDANLVEQLSLFDKNKIRLKRKIIVDNTVIP